MDLRENQDETTIRKSCNEEETVINFYNFYAEKARAEGYEYIAKAFKEMQDLEKIYAEETGNDIFNLIEDTKEYF